MILFVILSLGPLSFLMFLLISMPFLAFLDTLVHGWCKWSVTAEKSSGLFSCQNYAQWPWGKSLHWAEAAPTRRIYHEHLHPAQRYTRLSYPKPHRGALHCAQDMLIVDTQRFTCLTITPRCLLVYCNLAAHYG